MKWFYNLKVATKLIIGFIVVAIIEGAIGVVGIINLRKIQTADIDKATVNSATTTMVILIIAGMVIAIAIGIFISRLISKHVNNIVKVAEKIAIGDLNVSIDVDTKDEIGALAEAYRKMIGVIKMLVSDIDVLTQATAEGKLSTRADALKYSGDFKAIILGVNSTFDAMITPLSFASNYIARIANGEELEVIENVYKGDFAVLIDNLNKVRTSLYALLGETINLTNAAQKGDLSARGDSTVVKGGYANIIKGINDTLDAIVTPLNEAMQVMEKMAVNDFTMKMGDGHKGILKEFSDSINVVETHILSLQDFALKISMGDTTRLDEMIKIGKRSENDKLIPTFITMMKTIKELINEVEIMAKASINGDLSVRGNSNKFEGGYREIIEGFNNTMDAVVRPIKEASNVLKEMAEGSLTVSMNGDYKGDYARIKDDLNSTLRAFNEVLNDINNSAQQVASGAVQVSDSSQALSQGSTEQASSIEELTASIEEIAAQTKQNAVNANQANELALTAKEDAIRGNEQMKGMLKAMDDINNASGNISKIIKVIDEIAFQTNILALNAAVEAARAGQHGKGFAVVAEEVRNLAARSANAAKETTVLIEGSINKVGGGTKIANETAEALNGIVEGISKAAALVGEIASASSEQASGIAQINQGIAQVSQVVQTNSATSEESAAASEELSSQAEILKNMVGKFKLKKSDSSIGKLDELNPDILRMFESMAERKRIKSGGMDEARAEVAASRARIALSDKEFGKY